MTDTVVLDAIYQRSLERVKNLGEVFTPPSSVEEMLTLLSAGRKDFWGDINHVFFEPNCGHGNFVIAIYQKRLQALCKKAPSQNPTQAALFAIANAINTLWAIDIDAENVNQCRNRVFQETMVFLQQKTGIPKQHSVVKQHKYFFAHLICAINWHIQENETLSCLSDSKAAKTNAEKTRSGRQWFARHGHHPLNFNLSWAEHYQRCRQDNLTDLTFQRAQRFLIDLLAGQFQTSAEFQFANILASQQLVNQKPVIKTKTQGAG